ncbi:MAG TPA: hypothetical protein ENI23_17955 [bacterium]|nr:hypothetical protein [bacterium]
MLDLLRGLGGNLAASVGFALVKNNVIAANPPKTTASNAPRANPTDAARLPPNPLSKPNI